MPSTKQSENKSKDGILIVCGRNNQNKKKFTVINSPSKILSTWHLFFIITQAPIPIHSGFFDKLVSHVSWRRSGTANIYFWKAPVG